MASGLDYNTAPVIVAVTGNKSVNETGGKRERSAAKKSSSKC